MEKIQVLFPKEIFDCAKKIKEKGYQVFFVGGCVRDILMGKKPKDFDVATDAKPKETLKILKKAWILSEKFGTVQKKAGQNLLEITTFRQEKDYKDLRHPEKVEFLKSIEEDLKRRDFTINAIALKPDFEKVFYQNNEVLAEFEIIDPFSGREDLKKKLIRAVGLPDERFKEDALRLLRAVRFATCLGFKIERETFLSIKKHSRLIKKISKERIRDELEKILLSERAYEGFLLLYETYLMKVILPELLEGERILQKGYRPMTVFDHLLLSLKYAVKFNFSLEVRLASLFHDVGKPRAKKGDGLSATFYNHEVISEKITREILERLRFPKKLIEKVGLLVKNHMFYFDPKTCTESAVRKVLRKVGKENIKDLINLRVCDRKGAGCPKARPYKLRYFEYLVKKVSKDPIDTRMLKISGHDVMKILSIKPSSKVGLILDALLSEILESPSKNNEDYLKKRIKELGNLSEKELQKFREKLEFQKKEIEEEEKRKHGVK